MLPNDIAPAYLAGLLRRNKCVRTRGRGWVESKVTGTVNGSDYVLRHGCFNRGSHPRLQFGLCFRLVRSQPVPHAHAAVHRADLSQYAQIRSGYRLDEWLFSSSYSQLPLTVTHTPWIFKAPN